MIAQPSSTFTSISQFAASKNQNRPESAESFLGACRAALQRFEEAEALVVGGWQTLHDARGADFSGTREALDRIVGLYETRGRPEEAARYRDRLATATNPDSGPY